MLGKIRARFTPKEVTIFKLVLWVALLTWLVFFTIFGVLGTLILSSEASEIYEGRWYKGIMSFTLPTWFIFTVFLIDIGIMRYTNRKLRGPKNGSTNDTETSDRQASPTD